MTFPPTPAARWLRFVTRRWMPGTLLAVACLLSVLASRYVASTTQARARAQFLTEATQVRDRIQFGLAGYVDVVRTGAALLAARSEMNFAEFRAFVAGLKLHERYPIIRSLGFAQRVAQPRLASFVRLARLDGITGMRVWPAGSRDEYYPVVLMEPVDQGNAQDVGFDFATDAMLLAAMDRARDSGGPVASGELPEGRPMADGSPSTSFVLVPIYAVRAPVDTTEQRRQALLGFVFGSFRMSDLVRGIVPPSTALDVDIYDRPEGAGAGSVALSVTGANRFESRQPIQVADHEWLADVRSTVPAPATGWWLDPATLAGGLLLSGMLFLITWTQVRAHEAAERHEAELQKLARLDHLTGLPNRALFGEHLTKAIALARRHNTCVAVVFVDVDRFKHVNDSHGHAVGDLLLQSVARRLVGSVRGSDTVSRHGGDEFVLLLTDIHAGDRGAGRILNMIETLTAPHEVAGHAVRSTVSIGISMFPDDGEDAETLIRSADTAMYQAKERGRNNYQFFTPEMNARAIERRWIEMELRRAVESGQFVLHYQPKIDLGTGRMTGAEALVRWVSPDRGLIAPGSFVPIAEECGLIVPIGQWVLREACRQARAWPAAGGGLPVAVNISAIELRDRAFVDNLRSVLEETGLAPDRLEIELTESILMDNAAWSTSVLRDLKDLGVTIALDDFGTGYSSLSYLRRFPVDVLKVDQSFVQEINGGSHERSIVSAIISMARSLRQRVIAEGVETAQQLEFLQEQQCGEGQGFYFSRPLEADEFSSYLSDRPDRVV